MSQSLDDSQHIKKMVRFNMGRQEHSQQAPVPMSVNTKPVDPLRLFHDQGRSILYGVIGQETEGLFSRVMLHLRLTT